MNQIDQLLSDMDHMRSIVIAANPEDQQLRAMTRSMVSTLEKMRHTTGVPAETYLWICQMLVQFIDAEHSTMLLASMDDNLPEDSRHVIEAHIKQRLLLMQQTQQETLTIHQLLERSSKLIGGKARNNESLPTKALQLQNLLRKHLKKDASLHAEFQQLIDTINDSFSSISEALEQAGEDSPELQQTKLLLEQEFPEDIEQAREMLKNARQGILNASKKLAAVNTKMRDTMQQHSAQLSSLSGKLERAESAAQNDPLTGMANRRQLAEFLKNLAQSGYIFMILDIDFFKKINDVHGHDVGDEVLIQLAKVLRGCIRATDFSARIGGEDLCIIFPDSDLESSAKLAEILRQAIEIHPFKTSQGQINITVSIGAAEHSPDLAHATTFKAADQALYQSKKNGRNQISFADSNH